MRSYDIEEFRERMAELVEMPAADEGFVVTIDGKAVVVVEPVDTEQATGTEFSE